MDSTGQLHCRHSGVDHPSKEALTLIAEGKVPVKDLITHRLPLDDVAGAIDAVTSGTAIKVVIIPGGVD